jgi:pteridine reductase
MIDMSTLQDVFQCESPVALITGSGSPRVGRVIAEHLARLGCRIALHANASVRAAQQASESMLREFQVDVMVVSGELENPSVPERIVAEVHARFGRVDVLVNCAAIWRPTPLEQITADDLLRYLRINTMAPFLAAKAAGLIMVGQPAGPTWTTRPTFPARARLRR